MSSTALNTFSANRLQPAMYPEQARTTNVVFAASSANIAAGTLLGEVGGVNATATITISSGTTGGTFKITVAGTQTAAISWNSTNATLLSNIQSALDTALGTTAGAHNVVPSAVALTAGIGTILLSAQNAYGAQAITWSLADSTTGGTGTTIASTTTGVAPSGTYKVYSATATDGTQTPKAIAEYDMQIDASGNVTYSSTSGQSGGSQSETYKSGAVYVSGYFKLGDLVGLDSNAVSNLGAHFVNGALGASASIVRIP